MSGFCRHHTIINLVSSSLVIQSTLKIMGSRPYDNLFKMGSKKGVRWKMECTNHFIFHMFESNIVGVVSWCLCITYSTKRIMHYTWHIKKHNYSCYSLNAELLSLSVEPGNADQQQKILQNPKKRNSPRIWKVFKFFSSLTFHVPYWNRKKEKNRSQNG